MPASGITKPIFAQIGACLLLVGGCVAHGLAPYVVVAFAKPTLNLDAEDKAALTIGITMVVIALATGLIAYTAEEISDTLLQPVRTWLGGLSHYLVLIVAMVLFVLARAVSPGSWYLPFQFLRGR